MFHRSSLISNLSNRQKRNLKSLLRLSPSPSEESTSRERDGIQRKNFWPNLILKFTTIRYLSSVFALGKSQRMKRPMQRRMSTDVLSTELKRELESFCRPVIQPTSSFVLTFLQINPKNTGSIEAWQELLKNQTNTNHLF